jgi:dipeptidyl aminopeptidase/acylaminoacyl peptidase
MKRQFLSCFSLFAVSLHAVIAADVEAGKTPPRVKSAELQALDNEAKWTFEPTANRADPLYDRESVLTVELGIRESQERESASATPAANPNSDVLAFARDEQARIEVLVAAKKYDEVMRSAETALKRLEKNQDLPEVQVAISRISTFRDQADDAITRNEAQAQFDALGFKVQGVLWSESGSRLVILAGEPRAYGVNERVKDCVIINIDTDRVDFRFHYKRKRFEFPRYVGEDSRAVAQQPK